MTDRQWNDLLCVIDGNVLDPLPAGFIIDSPWLPGWHGVKMLDYFTSDEVWFDANMAAVTTFPDVIFLPGFWAEFGMCGEPSAFGARCTFPANEFPHVHKTIESIGEAARISKPDAETDGFGPFILNRLLRFRSRIEDAGHKIRFSVSRGHLNIASYLMGTTEMLTAMLTNPDELHALLETITSYLVDWHRLQRETFPSMEGIMVLDDLVGFFGGEEFKAFGLPYLKRIFAGNAKVKFFHNDADCSSSIGYLPEIGINLFNMAYDTSLDDLKEKTGGKVTMLGNIPPRDVLAGKTLPEIRAEAGELAASLADRSRIVFSCGGGMPPGVKTEQINAFLEGLRLK